MSQFHTETYSMGMGNLSEFAAPGNLGSPWLDPYIFSPWQPYLAGVGESVRSPFPKWLSRSALRTKENRKDAHPTSRLGVSRR